jgi:hypothetical protein
MRSRFLRFLTAPSGKAYGTAERGEGSTRLSTNLAGRGRAVIHELSAGVDAPWITWMRASDDSGAYIPRPRFSIDWSESFIRKRTMTNSRMTRQ